MTLPVGRLVKRSEASARDDEAASNVARAAARAMKEAAHQSAADEQAMDRVVDLSRLLAERLLGKALELEPDTIVALARRVLAEARSARSIRVLVQSSNVARLRRATEEFDPDGRVHAVVGDDALAPGDIRLETELGSVDARLETGLDGLADHLRDALRS
jgi:type III secretion protein L